MPILEKYQSLPGLVRIKNFFYETGPALICVVLKDTWSPDVYETTDDSTATTVSFQ